MSSTKEAARVRRRTAISTWTTEEIAAVLSATEEDRIRYATLNAHNRTQKRVELLALLEEYAGDLRHELEQREQRRLAGFQVRTGPAAGGRLRSYCRQIFESLHWALLISGAAVRRILRSDAHENGASRV